MYSANHAVLSHRPLGAGLRAGAAVWAFLLLLPGGTQQLSRVPALWAHFEAFSIEQGATGPALGQLADFLWLHYGDSHHATAENHSQLPLYAAAASVSVFHVPTVTVAHPPLGLELQVWQPGRVHPAPEGVSEAIFQPPRA